MLTSVLFSISLQMASTPLFPQLTPRSFVTASGEDCISFWDLNDLVCYSTIPSQYISTFPTHV